MRHIKHTKNNVYISVDTENILTKNKVFLALFSRKLLDVLTSDQK